ncbi:MAG TPA: sigma-70 family RNA polymerase sigma factor [Sandaracinaceae bacterium LLY-WYZ-13_1]|nr:sigma-70 family RNA polymerase sigma factor [Sandaracinaceae bacterium LLY-WYZ-13_1]
MWTRTRGKARVEEEAAPSDRDLTRDLFRAHAAYVFRLLRHFGVDDAELDDATQDVFVVVHRRVSDLDDRGSPRSWLYGIARRVASQYRRRSPRRRERPLSASPERSVAPTQLEAVQRRQARETLHALLGQLPEAQREVFVLYEIEQLPMRDVAETLGCPLQTGYSRLRTARDKLEQLLAAPTRRSTP